MKQLAMTTMQITGLLIILLASVVSLARSEDDVRTNFKPYRVTWETFKRDFNRRYSAEEEVWRFPVFVDNLRKMERHNQHYLQNRESFTMDINQFTDKQEGEEVFNCHVEEDDIMETANLGHRHKRQTGFCRPYTAPKGRILPSSLDWREKDAVTCVRSQGKCGSCYAFGVSTTIAAQLKLTGGKLIEMSQQQLVDCHKGCKGGTAQGSFQYIHEIGGIMSYSDYPYRKETAGRGRKGPCVFDKSKVMAKVTGCLISRHNETALKYMVALKGPVYVAIYVAPSFKSYRKGVFSSSNCLSDGRHCVTVIGYGRDETLNKDYWIIKNSWRSKWGMGGFGLIERGKNMCDIGNQIAVPEVEATGHVTQVQDTSCRASAVTSSRLMAAILCGLLWPFSMMTG